MEVGKGERRGRLERLAEVLSVSRNGAGKTEIVYNVNLNFQRVKRYLDYLEEKGLLENSGTLYKSTERGREFLRTYQLMNERCKKR